MRRQVHLCILALVTLLAMGCKDKEIVVENLSQKEANEILVALWDNNINAAKEARANRKSTSYNISVPRKQAHDALRILVINQLPNNQRAGLKEVYPVGSSGIIPTKSDEVARLTMALQGEVESLLKALPQVADAHIVLSLDTSNELSKQISPKSASLTLIYRPDPDNDISPFSELELQHLVSAAIGGLPAESVRVIMKALKPIKFLSLQETQTLKSPPSPSILSTNTFTWPLLTLVTLALLSSTYVLLRPRLRSWLRS